MPDLPFRRHQFYAGIDPGFSGAVAVISASGVSVRIWDMPTTGGKGRKTEIDLSGLHTTLRGLRSLPDCVVGVEWPTTRPGEGAERCERFGRQKGYLEAMLFCLGLDYYKIAPNLWKGRLDLPGKSDPDAKKIADRMFAQHYPQSAASVRGPRGGLLDGRCDAALIAHFIRTHTMQSGGGSVIETHGRNSPQALSLLTKAGSRPRRNKKPTTS